MQIFRQQLIAAVAKTVGAGQVGSDVEVLPRKVVFVLNVTKADGNTPTLDVVVQAKDPVSNVYTTIETFTQVTGSVTSERIEFKADTPRNLLESILRVSYAITHVSGADYDFTVSVQGKEGDEA